MEATRFIDQGRQTTNRRGREQAGLMDPAFFPEKYEITDLGQRNEDLDTDIYYDRRNTLKDRTPDSTSLFAYEEPRRRTDRTILQFTETGSRWKTDPYVNPNEDFNISFRDKDPRGALGETNWKEYRRVAEAHIANLDFKDDDNPRREGDGIHPNTLYARIRGAQNQLKIRWKNFQESFDGMGNTGVGIYAHKSGVYQSTLNDSLVQNDGEDNDGTEKKVFQHDFVNRLSNILQLGGIFRTNSTTDHRVNIASYGKLYKQKGLSNFGDQLREVEDDTMTAPGRVVLPGSKNKAIKRLMNTFIDQSNNQVNRSLAQENMQDSEFSQSKEADTKKIAMYQIISAMGLTESELDTLNLALSDKANHIRSAAEHDVANIIEIIDGMEAMSARELIELRDNVIRSTYVDTHIRKNMDESEVSQSEIARVMMQTNKKMAELGDISESRRQTETDRSIVRDLTDRTKKTNKKGDILKIKVTESDRRKGVELKKVANYKQKIGFNPVSNTAASKVEFLRESVRRANRQKFVDTDITQALQSTALDMPFGENRGLKKGRAKHYNGNHAKSSQTTSSTYDGMNEMAND